MRRRAVEVEVVLLDVLAVIAFVAGEAEEALLEDRVAAVPEREGEADVLVAVADAGDAVLVPAVGARAGVVVRADTPRRCRPGCSPRAPCPRRARSGRDPSASSAPCGSARFFEPPFFLCHRLCLRSVTSKAAGWLDYSRGGGRIRDCGRRESFL